MIISQITLINISKNDIKLLKTIDINRIDIFNDDIEENINDNLKNKYKIDSDILRNFIQTYFINTLTPDYILRDKRLCIFGNYYYIQPEDIFDIIIDDKLYTVPELTINEERIRNNDVIHYTFHNNIIPKYPVKKLRKLKIAELSFNLVFNFKYINKLTNTDNMKFKLFHISTNELYSKYILYNYSISRINIGQDYLKKNHIIPLRYTIITCDNINNKIVDKKEQFYGLTYEITDNSELSYNKSYTLSLYGNLSKCDLKCYCNKCHNNSYQKKILPTTY